PFPISRIHYHCSRVQFYTPHFNQAMIDRAHSLGMQYLQWFEIERAFPRTEMYTGHRELLLWCMTRSEFDLVDLGRPETRRLLFEKLSAMIREQNVDILRIDANIDPLLYWETNDEADRLGVKEMKYIEGLYALWDSLLAAFPRLKIDNCASGGRRLDFELTKRSVSYCRSDYTNNGIRGDMVRNTCLQTMHLNRYLPFTSPIVFSDPVPYLCRASFTGAVCFDEKYLAQDARETAAALIAECKRVRPLWNGDFYALTGDDALWSAYQVARGESGAAYFFRHPGSGEDRLTVGLQAIEEDALYRVDVTDEALHTVRGTKTGKELLLGVEILLKEPEESALLEYEKL
ncbi:MAG: alpha-galactosidase, partial [Clostridia bacterium]|nr:alpha-galactosidase [Clostridia bacterium]